VGVSLTTKAVDAGKTVIDASTDAAIGVSHVARDVTQATVQRVTAVSNTGIAVAREQVVEAKEKVVNILRSRAASADREPPLYWGEGGGGAAKEEEESEGDEEYMTLLQFEKSQEISIMPGRRERLPYILKKGHTITWEFRIKVRRRRRRRRKGRRTATSLIVYLLFQDHDLGFVVSETVQDFGGAHEVPLIEEQKHTVSKRGRRRREDWLP